jgi:mannose-6-phosphate isomerase-like protein (cupin superfamily)
MEVRRVVTGEDGGRAVVTTDDLAGPTTAPMPEGIRSTVIWVVEDSPPDPAQGSPDPVPEGSVWQLGPIPPSAIRWTHLEICPGATGIGMHKTDTVDLVEIRSGEIWLVLDGGDEVHLVAGDCVVQRETVHRWDNRGTEPCVLNVLMMSSESKG